MKAILESIITLPNLLELNLSSNKMGRKTAKALQSYLTNNVGSPCCLERLILKNAHVDDFEVRRGNKRNATGTSYKEVDEGITEMK